MSTLPFGRLLRYITGQAVCRREATRRPHYFRPRIEALEGRDLLTSFFFVVPAGVPTDNAKTFSTLQAALGAPGLAPGDVIQIEPGSSPGNVTAAQWKPLLLSSPSQFRPPQPPACDSAAVQADLLEIHSYSRVAPGTAASFVNRYKSFYWQSPEGLLSWPYRYADKWMAEDHLDRNPPRAARVYALIAAVMFDAFIASQDGKFTYWYIRPPQLDPAIVPLFPVPYFPSYPSNHSTFSAAKAELLAYLFPAHADFIRTVGKEAGDSRIWAGIHYQMDNAAGVQLGKSVAGVFIAWAESDGASGVHSDGLITIVLPAAIPGAISSTGISVGKFQGVIAA